MKFGDLLKTIGLVNKVPKNFTSAAGHNGQFADVSAANVDRIFHAFPPHRHYHNPYLGPTGIGATGTGYHPMVYGPRGYGLKLGVGGGATGHGHSAPAGVGHNDYGQNGYGVPPHHGGSAGEYDYGHSSFSKHKSKASSAMSALTLLSFFFFINLLQSCLKEHMEAMNPTVMVMTTGVARIRGNKFKDLYRPSSKEISADEQDQEEKFESRRRPGEWEEATSEMNSRTDDGERFMYPNRTAAGTKQRHDHYHDSFSNGKDELGHPVDQIRTKLPNDYFKDGSTHYTRIYR